LEGVPPLSIGEVKCAVELQSGATSSSPHRTNVGTVAKDLETLNQSLNPTVYRTKKLTAGRFSSATALVGLAIRKFNVK
jgi:hypothetical protein